MTKKTISFIQILLMTSLMLFCGTACGDNDNDNDDEIYPAEETDATAVGQLKVQYEGEWYKTENVICTYYIKDQRITLKLQGVKFVPQMPVTVSPILSEIPTWKDAEGVTKFAADKIVPKTDNIPLEAYTATGLDGQIKDGKLSFQLNFKDYPTYFKEN